MRIALSALALATVLTVPATTAEARWREGEDLRFVTQTSIPGPNGPMALCHLVDFMDVLFIPVYTTTKDYVLSENGCNGNSYRELTPQNFALFQDAGAIPADLPVEPTARLDKLAWGHALPILAALMLLSAGFKALRGGKRSKRNVPDALALHSLVAMSQVALADGRIDDAEVRQIAGILTRLTGQTYGLEQVADMLSKLNPTSSDLAQIGQDLSQEDREIILEAALNIAVADGEIHPSEYTVVSGLAQQMQIGADQFRNAMARISTHLQTVAPT